MFLWKMRAQKIMGSPYFFSLIVILSLMVSVGVVFFFLQESLRQSADQYKVELQRQLFLDLQEGDVPQLLRRLEAVAKNNNLVCLRAEREGIEFYRGQNNLCEGGPFQTQREFHHPAHGILLSFTWRVEPLLVRSFFAFLFFQLILGTLLMFLFRARQRLLYQSELALADLARQVAHDIRSPLAILRSTISKQQPMPHGAVVRLEELGESLLGSKKAPRFLCFGDLIAEVVEQKRLEFGVDFHVNVDLESSFANAFPPQPAFHWQRVISNLLNNSFEARREEGELNLKIKGGREGNFCHLSLNDNGLGFSPATSLEKGFASTKIKGFGLGLKGAHQWMVACGGKLEVKSNGEVGTTVELSSIPLLNRAFLVENDSALQLLWKKAAQRAGLELLVFASWEEFLDKGFPTWFPQEPLFLDFELSEGELPVAEVERTLARKSQGRKLWVYLSSGHPPEKFRHLSWVSAVVGKAPPWEFIDPPPENR